MTKMIWDYIRTAAACLGGWLGWYFGEMDGFFYTLLAFTIVDFITGVMAAWVDKELCSSVGYKGICRKVAIFILVGIAHIVDAYLIGAGSILRNAVIFFYLANEGVSIVENAGKIGLPIPDKLKEALVQLKDKAQDAAEDAATELKDKFKNDKEAGE